MNTNVDVLAEMEQAHATLKGLAYASELTVDHIQADAMLEARAAVTELIDKVDSYVTLGHSDTAYRELSEALARVKGD